MERNSPVTITPFYDLTGIADFSEEVCEVLHETSQIRIERIVSCGQCSEPGFWYDQEEDEWILLLCGEAKLRFDDQIVALGGGDSFLIPAHRRHRIESTGTDPKCIWLCVFIKGEHENGTEED